MKVTLFVPVLNEIDGLKTVMPQIPSGFCDQILVVDGQSSDGSAEFARAQGYEVYIQKKKGIRFAYREAWPLIRGDMVITFSPDGNCLPEAIPELIDKMKQGFDMVVASRYLGGDQSEDDDFVTRFGNGLFTGLINFFHGGNYTDAMGIFRAYRRDLFYELNLDCDSDYFPETLLGTVAGVEPLLSIRAAKRKSRISEIHAHEPARTGGLRKLHVIRWGLIYLIQTLREKFR